MFKVKASTLAEATVALVIVAIISGLALMTFISISNSSNNQLKVLALFELENIIALTHQEQSWLDEDYEKDNIIIEKTVQDYAQQKMLKEIIYKVSSQQGKLLFERKELININGKNTIEEDDKNEFKF